MPFKPINSDLRFQTAWNVISSNIGFGTLTLTRPGEANRMHLITALVMGYSASLSGGDWTLTDGSSNIILHGYIHDQTIITLTYPVPIPAGSAAILNVERRGMFTTVRASLQGITLDISEFPT